MARNVVNNGIGTNYGDNVILNFSESSGSNPSTGCVIGENYTDNLTLNFGSNCDKTQIPQKLVMNANRPNSANHGNKLTINFG